MTLALNLTAPPPILVPGLSWPSPAQAKGLGPWPWYWNSSRTEWFSVASCFPVSAQFLLVPFQLTIGAGVWLGQNTQSWRVVFLLLDFPHVQQKKKNNISPTRWASFLMSSPNTTPDKALMGGFFVPNTSSKRTDARRIDECDLIWPYFQPSLDGNNFYAYSKEELAQAVASWHFHTPPLPPRPHGSQACILASPIVCLPKPFVLAALECLHCPGMLPEPRSLFPGAWCWVCRNPGMTEWPVASTEWQLQHLNCKAQVWRGVPYLWTVTVLLVPHQVPSQPACLLRTDPTPLTEFNTKWWKSACLTFQGKLGAPIKES